MWWNPIFKNKMSRNSSNFLGPNSPQFCHRWRGSRGIVLLVDKTTRLYKPHSIEFNYEKRWTNQFESWNSTPTFTWPMHFHHVWSMHLAPPKSWILRAAQDPDGFWALGRFGNRVSEPDLLFTRFQQNFEFPTKNSKFSSSWPWPWSPWIFWHRIFWNLSSSESETT